MSYFSKYPTIRDYEIDGKFYNAIDITRRTGIPNSFKNNSATYLEYDIQDGETAIILADRLYDDPNLFWVILYFNDIFDIENKWPLTSSVLTDYINRIYDDPNAIHHYESFFSGAIVSESWNINDRVSITNFEYEFKLNEEKRKIRVPIPESIGTILEEHNRLLTAL